MAKVKSRDEMVKKRMENMTPSKQTIKPTLAPQNTPSNNNENLPGIA